MFCEKCGKQIPDGAVCSCQQANQQYQAPQAPKAPKVPSSLSNLFTVPLAKLASLGLALLSALFLFVDGWWGVTYWGSTSRYSALGVPGSGSAFDASAILGVASIFAYLTLICFFICFVSEFINWNKLTPALSKLKNIIKVVYYGLYTFVFLLTFIGSFIARVGSGPSWAMIFVFFIAGGGLALSIVQFVTKK